MLAGERGADPEVYLEMKKKLGLDKSIISQYGIFLKNIFQGDLGKSIVSKRSVWDEFMELFPATLELGLSALLLAIVVGVPLGIISAIKRGGPLDYALVGGSLVGHSMPIFWWGLLMIMVFSVNLGWTPVFRAHCHCSRYRYGHGHFFNRFPLARI